MSTHKCVRVSVRNGCVSVFVHPCVCEVVGIVNTYMYASECLVCVCLFVTIHVSVKW